MFFSGGLAATYVLYDSLHLINSFLVFILPSACDVWFVFMLMNFFRGIPKEMEEAALIDGCNQIQVLFKVYLPLSLPALVTIVLFTAVGQWNSWFDGMLFMNDPNNYPLQSYLYNIIISSDPSKLIAAGSQLTPEQLEALGQNSEIEYSHVINVYLAGKIKPNGWRQKLIDIRNNFFFVV